MKKNLFLFALITGCYGYGFATNQITFQAQTQDTKVKPKVKKKVIRYDFSLFKFIVPSKTFQKKDSTNLTEERFNALKSKDETTFHQEKPFVFFKFS